MTRYLESLDELRHGITVLYEVEGKGGHGEDLDREGHDGGVLLLVVPQVVIHYQRVVLRKDHRQSLLALIVFHQPAYQE